jgi:hypothetical protein
MATVPWDANGVPHRLQRGASAALVVPHLGQVIVAVALVIAQFSPENPLENGLPTLDSAHTAILHPIKKTRN